jgi:hypothetical protein
MYFSNFPQITYTLDGGDTGLVVTDIFRRVIAQDQNLSTALSYDEYDIVDGETPEIVAHQVYGNADLHWIILTVNNIIDPRYDWPMPTSVFQTFVTNKYGVGNELNIHHYENDDGDVVHVSYTAGPKTAITNLEYEESLSEQKRRIKLLKPVFVETFIKNFERLMRNG